MFLYMVLWYNNFKIYVMEGKMIRYVVVFEFYKNM